MTIRWINTSAHYSGDALIHLPQAPVTFTGDLVYVDRLLGVFPQSKVRKAQQAFARLHALSNRHICSQHGPYV